MKQDRWTYKVMPLPYKIFLSSEKKSTEYQDILNQEGLRGWELINVVIDGSGYTYAYFKK